MKFKPTIEPDGMAAELSPKETQFSGESSEPTAIPLPVFRLNKILAPVDFSDRSNQTLQYAIAFARQFQGSLVLLHVVQPYLPVPEMAAVNINLTEREMRETGEKGLRTLQRTIPDDVVSETAVREGNPHLEIVKAAKELGIDLIILSTHGHTGLAHVLLGSTAERVVRHAGCPVLVVREREHEFVASKSAKSGG